MSEPADWDHWLKVIEDEVVNLSQWEEEFIASLRAQLEQGRRLSERQGELLERIYAEKTP